MTRALTFFLTPFLMLSFYSFTYTFSHSHPISVDEVFFKILVNEIITMSSINTFTQPFVFLCLMCCKNFLWELFLLFIQDCSRFCWEETFGGHSYSYRNLIKYKLPMYFNNTVSGSAIIKFIYWFRNNRKQTGYENLLQYILKNNSLWRL